VASDPGRATVPCIAAPHMLPSAVATASAPATSRISWLNPTPHMITVYASPWSSPSPTQHSLPSGRYPLPGPDFHRLDPASFAWRTATPSSQWTYTTYSLPVSLAHPCENAQDATRRRIIFSIALFPTVATAPFLFRLTKSRKIFYAHDSTLLLAEFPPRG